MNYFDFAATNARQQASEAVGGLSPIRSETLLARSEDYSIALQRAIEHHCRGVSVPDAIAVRCPHHAKMLNEHLANIPGEVALPGEREQ